MVPVTEEFSNLYTHLFLVHAESEQEAYNKVIERKGLSCFNVQKYTEKKYETFYEDLQTTSTYFPISQKYDILSKIFSEKGEKYVETVELYDYMFWGDYNAQIRALASKAILEDWSFEGRDDYGILKNYLNNTFIQLQKEGKVLETESCCIFNTGLFTAHYVPIYAYGELNKKYTENENYSKWYFKGFKDEYELAALDVDADYPERADYFKDTTLLVFDWHCKIHVNYKHILEDLGTADRLPSCIKESDRPLDALKGYIDTAIQRVIANYKLAVPHYYQDRIQLMIPLCFSKDDNPDVALVLDKRSGKHYQARTCLTMEMAYMDARLIAKPESNWLIAENILQQNKLTLERTGCNLSFLHACT